MLDNSGSMSAKLYNSVQVYYPLDVATDSSGNIYVMEYYNNRIKVFDSSGAYLRSFGGYGNACNQFNMPRQFDIIMMWYILRILMEENKDLNGQCCRLNEFRGGTYPHAIAMQTREDYILLAITQSQNCF